MDKIGYPRWLADPKQVNSYYSTVTPLTFFWTNSETSSLLQLTIQRDQHFKNMVQLIQLQRQKDIQKLADHYIDPKTIWREDIWEVGS